MQKAGYSGTPLAKKLGIKERFVIRLINQPSHYFQLFDDLPAGVKIIKDNKTKVDCIHFFAMHAKELHSAIPSLRDQIRQNGFIWISWYKRSANMATDVTEDLVRTVALQNGLVDIKVCAVDHQWSGLKLVIPVKERRKS